MSVRSSKSGTSLNSKKSKIHTEGMPMGTINSNSNNSVGFTNVQNNVILNKKNALMMSKEPNYMQLTKSKKKRSAV
eukprot:CAMPEP_0170553484 /NCGR_PEP_ID=MMETSP0211-20121228/11312_1 /TAXON_ID=311385 /ORGANISM="Pseudokeronopsis sp., Strain OXSARD2" /LENGTH=75 /DNA_ID=CAMNT_0010861847 /DNA_START=3103 /DNA_END=3330 /DNA_ORIENTATION=+